MSIVCARGPIEMHDLIEQVQTLAPEEWPGSLSGESIQSQILKLFEANMLEFEQGVMIKRKMRVSS